MHFQIGIIGLMAFLLSVLGTSIEIPILQRKHSGQSIREEGPQSHMAKAGTPTMGGIAILIATIGALIVVNRISMDLAAIVIVFILFAALGFLDVYIKVTKKHNLGLLAWQKLALQVAIGVGLAMYVTKTSLYGSLVFIPFANIYVDFGIWFIPFIVFVVVAMTNAVNITDGLDGLASGITALVALFFAVAAATFGFDASMMFCAALMGACLGFLVFNKNPAKVFMGDTGSLALGGGLATAAIVMNLELLLPLVGFIYVLEALSVIIQVISFKTTGKRVFKMSPLHHHFELSGMKEKHVVGMFWAVTLGCCVIGLAAL